MVKLLDYLIYRRMILVFLTQDMSQHLHAEHTARNRATGFKYIGCLILIFVIATYMGSFVQMLFITLGIADYYPVPTRFNLTIMARTEVFAFRQCKVLI